MRLRIDLVLKKQQPETMESIDDVRMTQLDNDVNFKLETKTLKAFSFVCRAIKILCVCN